MLNRPRWIALAIALVLALMVGVLVVVVAPFGVRTDGRPASFVYRTGNRLYLDGHSYRFTGVNIPWANDRHPGGCAIPVTQRTLGRVLDRINGHIDAVRVFFFQSQATLAGQRDWTAFDQTLHAIARRGLKVIVTLGEQNGSCGDPGGVKDITWYQHGYADLVSPGYPQTYRDYVRDVVTRYRDNPEILAWQLINEASIVSPPGICADEAAAARILRSWADDVAAMIRSIDPYHLISLGTGLQGGCGYAVTGDPSSNDYAYVHAGPDIDLCEYHDYNAVADPLPEAERQEMDACAALDKPLFVGEVGIPSSDPNRPALLGAKLGAQFKYAREPLQGALVWELGSAKVGMCDQFCATLGDPLLGVLGRFDRIRAPESGTGRFPG